MHISLLQRQGCSIEFASRAIVRRIAILAFLVAIVSIQQPGASGYPAADAGFGTLTPGMLDKIDDATVRLDLILMRLKPELLESKQFMRYFIALNNCGNATIQAQLDNELDYPKLVAYYRPRAQQILASLPNSVTLNVLNAPVDRGGWKFGDVVSLGEYDTTKGAFPLHYTAPWGSRAPDQSAPSPSPTRDNTQTTIRLGDLFKHKKASDESRQSTQANQNHVIELKGQFEVHYNRHSLLTACPVANYIASQSGSLFGSLPGDFAITYPPTGFDEFPTPESEARQYISKHSATERAVALLATIAISDQPPQVDQMNRDGKLIVRQATFSGHVARVSLRDLKLGGIVGTLMDDHTVPPPAPANNQATSEAETPGPASPAPAAIDLRAQIPVAAAAYTAMNACGWPVSPDKRANLFRFVATTLRSTQWGGRLQGDLKMEQDRMVQVGRAGYCHSSAERQRFDSSVAKLWPEGQVAAPPAQ